MAALRDRRPSLLSRVSRYVRAVGLLGGLMLPSAEAAFVDALLADVDGVPVAASDIALARGLGLFGFASSTAPITATDLERFVDVRLVLAEAERLRLEAPAEEVERAWAAAATRGGGMAALTAWLAAVGIARDWAERMVEAEWRWKRFLELRFQAFVVVTEAEVAAAMGPGPHGEAARERVRTALRLAAVERGLAAWLTAARTRASIRLLWPEEERIPNPFPMPPAAGQSGAEP